MSIGWEGPQEVQTAEIFIGQLTIVGFVFSVVSCRPRPVCAKCFAMVALCSLMPCHKALLVDFSLFTQIAVCDQSNNWFILLIRLVILLELQITNSVLCIHGDLFSVAIQREILGNYGFDYLYLLHYEESFTFSCNTGKISSLVSLTVVHFCSVFLTILIPSISGRKAVSSRLLRQSFQIHRPLTKPTKIPWVRVFE